MPMKTLGLMSIFAVAATICTQMLAGHHNSSKSSDDTFAKVRPEHSSDTLVVSNATIRALLPGQTTTVASFIIANNGHSDCNLLSADSSRAERIEFHTHQHHGDMVRMRPLDQVEVPAGESVAFESRGLHLMLFGVDSLSDSDGVTQVNLHTDQCGSVSISLPVQEIIVKSMDKMVH